MYDPQLGRWHSIDKLSEKYYSLSPFAYCANNPIRLIDVDGRYFEDENEERAQKKERRIIRKQHRLGNKVIRMAAKGKDTSDIEARQDELDKSLNDIQKMRDDMNTEFRYASIYSKEARKNKVYGPETKLMPETNSKGDKVVTMFTENRMGSKLHEGRHGGDIARGDMVINSTGGYGVSHEVSAYRAQYSWRGNFKYREYMSGESFGTLYMKGFSTSYINKMLIRSIKCKS